MKAIKYLFLAALTILALASCTKNPNGGNGGNNDNPAFVAAVDINGAFDDWSGVKTELTSETGPVYSFKATYDEKYIYFYIKRNLNDALFPPEGNGYFYFCIEADEDATTGLVAGPGIKVNDQWLVPASSIDSWFFAYLYAENYKFAATPSGQSYPTDFMANIISAGKCNVAQETIEIEVRANREDMLIQQGKTISIHTWGNKSASNVQATPLKLTIEK